MSIAITHTKVGKSAQHMYVAYPNHQQTDVVDRQNVTKQVENPFQTNTRH
nr:hypothetical protein [uncultured Vibrio sp.]